MAEAMLSLATNPYDPFEQYDLWSAFDIHEGYDTAGLMARLVGDLDGLTEIEVDTATHDAVNSIILNPSFEGTYKKVVRKS